MYREWGSHVGVLGASIRSVEHIKTCTAEQISAITIPFKLIKEIHDGTVAVTESKSLALIEYKELEELPWAEYDIEHELTVKGLEKFAADWNALCE
jgi:transaldolase